MTIHYLWTPKYEFKVTGNGYVNNGHVELNQQQLWYEENPDLKKLVEISALDNNTSIVQKSSKPTIMGSLWKPR